MNLRRTRLKARELVHVCFFKIALSLCPSDLKHKDGLTTLLLKTLQCLLTACGVGGQFLHQLLWASHAGCLPIGQLLPISWLIPEISISITLTEILRIVHAVPRPRVLAYAHMSAYILLSLWPQATQTLPHIWLFICQWMAIICLFSQVTIFLKLVCQLTDFMVGLVKGRLR